MNELKPKTIFDERDRLKQEVAKLAAQLAATEEALRQVQLESAELRRQNQEMRSDLEQGFMEGAYARLKNLQAAEDESERMRKVCDAAVGLSITKKLFWQIGRDLEPALCDTVSALDRAVAEYRKQQEVKPDA